MVFEPKQFGRFYLLEKLAVGGMAEIYKAKTYGAEGFEKLLAIKRILPHCSADKEFITMLIDEAKLSVLLSHANIVQVYDLGKVGDDYFISMEYINGINLRDILYRCRELGRPIPPELAVYVMSEVCKGLDYAHRKADSKGHPLGIVHRDISPQNILISFEGEVKIVDFGIAKAAMNISHTMAGILKGKISYMSPEQALGKPIDYRTDIFSVGIILYECLLGKKLFKGESQFEVLKKIRTTRVTRDNLPQEIPLPVRSVLAKSLAYVQKERFNSAGDIQSELTRVLYSMYVDFTPQRLAAFVRELFADELKRQHSKAMARHHRERQTESMSIDPKGSQQNIVHRDRNTDSDFTDDTSHSSKSAVPLPPERSLSSIEHGSQRLQTRLATAIAVVILLAGGAYGYVQWFHPRLFPPGATQNFTTVRITSQPKEAAIFLDGTPMKQLTPALIENLQVNKRYTITLSKKGYLDVKRTITPTSTEPITLELALRPGSGTLIVSSTPPGASIFLNGKDSGHQTPATISNFTLNDPTVITLQKSDFQPHQETIIIKQLDPQQLKIALAPVSQDAPGTAPKVLRGPDLSPQPEATPHVTPKATPPTVDKRQTPEKVAPKARDKKTVNKTPATKRDTLKIRTKVKTRPKDKAIPEGKGTITIKSRPKGATVYVDGRKFGRAPMTIRGIASGARSIRLVLKGYNTWSQSVSVPRDKEQSVNARMQKSPKGP